MAEIFSIIVFILLLVCAILLEQERHELDDVKTDLSIARSFVEQQDPMALDDVNWLDTYRALQDSLGKTLERVQSLHSDSLRMRGENETLRSSLESAEFRSRLPETVANQRGQLEVLENSLRQAAESLQETEDLNRELERLLLDTRTLYMAAVSELERLRHLDSTRIGEQLQRIVRVDSLEEALNQARDAIANLHELQPFRDSLEDTSPEDSLRNIAIHERKRSEAYRDQAMRATREREEAVGRAELREEQLNQLTGGRGIDPPPCWLNEERRPEYILRIELTNNGFRLFKIAPPRHSDDNVMPHLATIQQDREYPPSQFLAMTRPIYEEGLRRTKSFGPRGCRFWVRPVDSTGSSKEVFQRREADLGKHFWFRWY